MSFLKLLHACEYFNKVAQKNEKRIEIDPTKKNIDFWSNYLYHAIQSYALKLVSPKAAKDVFDNIAKYNRSPAYESNKDARDIDLFATAIKTGAAKLVDAGLNPLKVLQQKGMSSLNPNMLAILVNNLDVLREAKDFSKYQHYYLQAAGAPKEIIELDEPETSAKLDPGY